MLALLCAALAQTTPSEEDPLHRVVVLELNAGDPVLAGHGPSKQSEYVPAASGVLYLWAVARDADLFLRVEETERATAIAEDDDSGGGTTPFVVVDAVRGRGLSLRVAAHVELAEPRSIALHAILAPEDDQSRETAAWAGVALDEVQRLHASGAIGDARTEIEALVDEVCALESAGTSARVNALVADLGQAAHDLGLPTVAARARRMVVAFAEHHLPAQHRGLQHARGNLSQSLYETGELDEALALAESVHDTLARTFGADDPDLGTARINLGAILHARGDFERARSIQELAVEAGERRLEPDDLSLQMMRENLATALANLGELERALELQRRVVRARAGALPAGHPMLAAAHGNVGWILHVMGDLHAARELEEQVLHELSLALPDDHPQLQIARANLALTIKSQLGDLDRARLLEEKVLEIRLRAKAPDPISLALARGNLANTLKLEGKLEQALQLEEQVLEAFSRVLGDDNPLRSTARLNLAVTLMDMGKIARARELLEAELELRSATLPEEHPHLQLAHENLGLVLFCAGEFEEAASYLEQALRARCAMLPEDHDVRIRNGELLAVLDAHRGRASEAIARTHEVLGWVRSALRVAALASSPREVEACATRLADRLSWALSLSQGYAGGPGDSDLCSACFETIETLRGAGSISAWMARRAAHDVQLATLRASAQRAAEGMARASAGDLDSERLVAAMTARDDAQRELARHLADDERARTALVTPGAGDLAGTLGPNDAAVAYWRYLRIERDEPAGPAGRSSVEHMLAFVLKPDGTLVRYELGAVHAIETAVERWRRTLTYEGGEARGEGLQLAPVPTTSERAAGDEVRAMVLDPVLDALGGAGRVIVVADDVLHTIPLDALPLGDGRVGDRFRLEPRSTLRELVVPLDPPRGTIAVLVGGVDYGAATRPAEASQGASPAQAGAARSILRRGRFAQGFAALPATETEASEVARILAEAGWEPSGLIALEGQQASKEALRDLAPQVRVLHLATHGWLAEEVSPPTSGELGSDGYAGGRSPALREQLRATSPMVLCGLALAGANLPADELGRISGAVTAEELATMDLAGCELAVLSACDTNVGVRSAGQGVASLQKALHMAGARSVITSLWKVPDEATKDLMIEFYRRVWLEKQPKQLALWEAKGTLRARGRPPRDWAAWVLTGEPE